MKDHAYKRAVDLIADEFFRDCTDELAPFGSDEGDMALTEFREWRKVNPNVHAINALNGQ